MMKTKFTAFMQLISVAFSSAAIFFAIFVFFTEFNNVTFKGITLGVLGALTGAITAYLSTRIQDLTFAPQLNNRKEADQMLREIQKIPEPKVFISYAHGDEEFVSRLYTELQKKEYTIYWDKNDIKVGDNIKTKIDFLLESSDYVVFIESKNSISSPWASHELAKAKELGKKILPAQIDDSERPKELKEIMYADFKESFQSGISQLTQALTKTSTK